MLPTAGAGRSLQGDFAAFVAAAAAGAAASGSGSAASMGAAASSHSSSTTGGSTRGSTEGGGAGEGGAFGSAPYLYALQQKLMWARAVLDLDVSVVWLVGAFGGGLACVGLPMP